MNEGFWVIETAQSTYWDGRKIGDDAHFDHDVNKAIRFSRYEDAETVRSWLLEKPSRGSRLRSAQHAFISP